MNSVPSNLLNTIVSGDARELSKQLPNESIDLIFTDPPYPKEFLSLYGWLASEAVRILKPGGWLFAYGAGEYIPDILDLLRVPDLNYFWLFTLNHNGGYPRVWYKKLMSGYKPIFVFTKGKPSILHWQASTFSYAADKRFHKWGQGAGMAVKTIDILTRPNDIIFDPFCGGGTTAAACVMLNRNYIAFEIDSNTAKIAQERINQTQPPLLNVLHSQVNMAFD